jgi:hypothetical protein
MDERGELEPESRDGVAEGRAGDRRVGTPYDLFPTVFMKHMLSSYRLKQC